MIKYQTNDARTFHKKFSLISLFKCPNAFHLKVNAMCSLFYNYKPNKLEKLA